jgi:saccharopine dehydrogenase-like NADP-dependent oxidoreductase
MACRSPSRCTAAAAEVKNRTGADDRRVPTMTLDLASYKSIRQFVEEYKKRKSVVLSLVVYKKKSEYMKCTLVIVYISTIYR